VERSIALARQLCEALEAAHTKGVVHRDLKPQNVLIDAEGNAYISDFGLAKSLEAGAARLTQTGQFFGTPRYMSPEQVERGTLDHRSDLYALGLIFYEMVAGDVPFRGGSAFQLMYQRIREPAKSPQLANPDLPDYITRIILRCLQKDPDRRYQTAREVLNDLDAERAPSRARTVITRSASLINVLTKPKMRSVITASPSLSNARTAIKEAWPRVSAR
jgi:serine/threonine protein kinase